MPSLLLPVRRLATALLSCLFLGSLIAATGAEAGPGVGPWPGTPPPTSSPLPVPIPAGLRNELAVAVGAISRSRGPDRPGPWDPAGELSYRHEWNRQTFHLQGYDTGFGLGYRLFLLDEDSFRAALGFRVGLLHISGELPLAVRPLGSAWVHFSPRYAGDLIVLPGGLSWATDRVTMFAEVGATLHRRGIAAPTVAVAGGASLAL